MKKYIFILAAAFMTFTAQAQQTVEGVEVEGSLSKYGKELTLNGAGLREKVFIDLYVGGLYVTEKSDDGEALTSSDQSMAITLDIVSKLVTQDNMISSIEEGFENSCSSKEYKALSGKIEKFIALFKEEIVKGDEFVLFYIPGEGTKVSKNGKELGTIPGLDFKKGLFGIWLGDYPADEELKEGLLGL
ncbi:MAG: chalcone isomerase family protein [Bacteroidota bacterium]|nr:chalcone isomerase family protein [Bacteroidota bacterium]